MTAYADAHPPKVVVIGANGFLGRRVVEGLRRSGAFHPVAALRRRPADGSGGEWVLCDATEPAALAAALEGADSAINCVAGDGATMLAATRNLCAAAQTAGLRRVVHLSSMAVYGNSTGLVGGDAPLDPAPGWYASAKVACEAIVQAFVSDGGDAVLLRPGCIHGPCSAQWTGRIGRLLQQHRIGDLGAAGDGGCNLIDVDDVAAAVVAALQRPGLAGAAFNLGDPDPDTWNAYFMAFGIAIGATPVSRIGARRLKLEAKALAIPLKLAQIAAGRIGRAAWVPEPLSPSLLALWRQDIRLDHRKADAMLGFSRTPQAVAIRRAAHWFTAAG